MSFKCNVTVYDAYFLALSQLESKPFVTADYKFTGRIKGFKDIVNLTVFAAITYMVNSLWKKMIGKPYSGKLNARFYKGELEIGHGEARDALSDERDGNRYVLI